MAMTFFHKGKAPRVPWLIVLHFDPPEIDDTRESEWKPDTSAEAIPTLTWDHAGVREAKLTLPFNDFALGRQAVLQPGVFSTKESIRWFRQRQQPNPGLWNEPPVLVFTGLRNEIGTSKFFECVIKSVNVKSKVHAGHEVLARPGLLAFTNVLLNDIVRAEVEITLQEKIDPTEGQPQSLLEAFQFGVREGLRQGNE